MSTIGYNRTYEKSPMALAEFDIGSLGLGELPEGLTDQEKNPDNEPVADAYRRRLELLPVIVAHLKHVKPDITSLEALDWPSDIWVNLGQGEALKVKPRLYVSRLVVDTDYRTTFYQEGLAGINARLFAQRKELEKETDSGRQTYLMLSLNDLLGSAIRLYPHKAHTVSVSIDRDFLKSHPKETEIERSRKQLTYYVNKAISSGKDDITLLMELPCGRKMGGSQNKYAPQSQDVFFFMLEPKEAQKQTPVLATKLYHGYRPLYIPLPFVHSVQFSRETLASRQLVNEEAISKAKWNLWPPHRFFASYLEFRNFSQVRKKDFAGAMIPHYKDPYLWAVEKTPDQAIVHHAVVVGTQETRSRSVLYDIRDITLPLDTTVDYQYLSLGPDIISYIVKSSLLPTRTGSDEVIEYLMRIPHYLS